MSFPRALACLPLIAALCAACYQDDLSSTSTATGSGGATGTGGSTGTTGGEGGAGGHLSDGAQGTPSTTYPAPFPKPPQVIDFGGPVLASPKFVPVFFSNDDASEVAQIEDYVNTVGGTSYWTAAVSEYGVGAGVSTAPVNLTETAPTTIQDSDIQTWLASKLDGDDPAWPAADDNTIYVLHYPAGTTITYDAGMGMVATSCQVFGGYHSNITLDGAHGGINVAYAVLPRCPGYPAGDGYPGMTDIQVLTSSESHEMIEGSTDPYPSTDPAYADVDPAHEYWDLSLGGGEIGDMCAQFDGVFTTFPGLPYTVQRVWSNKAALAGNDPCVPPLPSEVYFNAAPELTSVSASIEGETLSENGVQIPVGKSKTIMLDLFSSASTSGPFSVHVDDGQALMGGTQLLSFSVGDTPTIPCPTGAPKGSVCVGGENGQKIPVTITVMSAGSGNIETFWVVSYQPGDANENFWIGLVTN